MGLKLNHVSKRGHMWLQVRVEISKSCFTRHLQIRNRTICKFDAVSNPVWLLMFESHYSQAMCHGAWFLILICGEIAKSSNRWPIWDKCSKPWFTYSYSSELLSQLPALQWRRYRHQGVSNRQCLGCLLNRLFRLRSKKTSKLRVIGLCEENSPVTGEFPARRASNAQNVSIWWRHHDKQPLNHPPHNVFMIQSQRKCISRWPPSVVRFMFETINGLSVFAWRMATRNLR